MNADEIRGMSAGKELDILIATKLFGWRWFAHVRETPLGTSERLVLLPADCKLPGYIPVTVVPDDISIQLEDMRPYSTDRTACGAVIDWANGNGIFVSIFYCLDLHVLCKCWHYDNPAEKVLVSGRDESATICKAVAICALQNGLISEDAP